MTVTVPPPRSLCAALSAPPRPRAPNVSIAHSIPLERVNRALDTRALVAPGMAAIGPDVGFREFQPGLGTGLGLLGGAVHLLPRVLVDGIERGRVDAAPGQDRAVPGQGVAGQPLLDFVGRTVLG